MKVKKWANQRPKYFHKLYMLYILHLSGINQLIFRSKSFEFNNSPDFQVENLTIVDESHELQFEDDDDEQTQAHELPDYACKYCGLHDPVIQKFIWLKYDHRVMFEKYTTTSLPSLWDVRQQKDILRWLSQQKKQFISPYV